MTRDIAASVRGQLQNRAKQTGRPFQELLQYFAMERFLYRLSKSEHASRFVLKGALMFRVWNAAQSRATRDIDFLARADNDVESTAQMFKAVCDQDVMPDGVIFHSDTVQGIAIKEDADYLGVRVTFRATIQNARLPMQIDTGFGDVVNPAPAIIEYPALLDFEPARLAAYPAETVIAEKFEAMVKLVTALYARRSRRRESDYPSCDAQIDTCRKYALSQGWGSRVAFIDDGKSGETLERTALKEMLEAVRRGEVKRIVVTSFDRLTRKLAHLGQLLDEFSRVEVVLAVVDFPEFNTPTGRLMANIIGAANEFQIELTKERLADARAERLGIGIYTSRQSRLYPPSGGSETSLRVSGEGRVGKMVKRLPTNPSPKPRSSASTLPMEGNEICVDTNGVWESRTAVNPNA